MSASASTSGRLQPQAPYRGSAPGFLPQTHVVASEIVIWGLVLGLRRKRKICIRNANNRSVTLEFVARFPV